MASKTSTPAPRAPTPGSSALKNVGSTLGKVVRGGARLGGFTNLPGLGINAAIAAKDIYDQYRDNPATAPIQSPEAFHERIYGQGGFKRGGKVKGGSASRRADGIAHKGKTKGKVVKMASGGTVGGSYRKAADGIASKGKTKGKIVKMMMGGVCK